MTTPHPDTETFPRDHETWLMSLRKRMDIKLEHVRAEIQAAGGSEAYLEQLRAKA